MMTKKNIGGTPACFSYYELGGKVTLLDERRYSFLFILEGSVRNLGSCHIEKFESRTLAVIDKRQINQCICTAGTSLLEFIPPRRIDYFFRSASSVFGTSCSEHVPFTSEIEHWIEQLRNECLLGRRPDEYSYCCQLRDLLRQCPDIVLGTLVIPLHACALTSKKCMQCKEKCNDTQKLPL